MTYMSRVHPQAPPNKNPVAAQPIEIRGFRLTTPFTLAYDGSRADKAERAYFPVYAIFDLASGTVLDRGSVAARGGLDVAPLRALTCWRYR
jgi:hypothetical protein